MIGGEGGVRDSITPEVRVLCPPAPPRMIAQGMPFPNPRAPEDARWNAERERRWPRVFFKILKRWPGAAVAGRGGGGGFGEVAGRVTALSGTVAR